MPNLKECSLCGSNGANEIYCPERRPTGGKGVMQTWGYCRICAPQYFDSETNFVSGIPPRPPKPVADNINNADDELQGVA